MSTDAWITIGITLAALVVLVAEWAASEVVLLSAVCLLMVLGILTPTEALGFDALWTAEHFLAAPGLYGTVWMSPLLCLAHAASVTTRIRLATGLLILPYYPPVTLAREIQTLWQLTGGRFVLGVGEWPPKGSRRLARSWLAAGEQDASFAPPLDRVECERKA